MAASWPLLDEHQVKIFEEKIFRLQSMYDQCFEICESKFCCQECILSDLNIQLKLSKNENPACTEPVQEGEF